MNSVPIRFEVKINGKPIAITGVGSFGVLTAIVHWVRRNPDAITEKMLASPEFNKESFLKEVCELEMTALNSVKDEHSSWGRHSLQAGDEVTIRVLSSGEYDIPNNAS